MGHTEVPRDMGDWPANRDHKQMQVDSAGTPTDLWASVKSLWQGSPNARQSVYHREIPPISFGHKLRLWFGLERSRWIEVHLREKIGSRQDAAMRHAAAPVYRHQRGRFDRH